MAGYRLGGNGYQLTPTGTPVTHSFTTSTGGSFTQPQPRDHGQAGSVGSGGDGWYSYNLGHGHLISLNVECAVQAGSCSPTGSWFAGETHWLAQDLAADHAPRRPRTQRARPRLRPVRPDGLDRHSRCE